MNRYIGHVTTLGRMTVAIVLMSYSSESCFMYPVLIGINFVGFIFAIMVKSESCQIYNDDEKLKSVEESQRTAMRVYIWLVMILSNALWIVVLTAFNENVSTVFAPWIMALILVASFLLDIYFIEIKNLVYVWKVDEEKEV